MGRKLDQIMYAEIKRATPAIVVPSNKDKCNVDMNRENKGSEKMTTSYPTKKGN